MGENTKETEEKYIIVYANFPSHIEGENIVHLVNEEIKRGFTPIGSPVFIYSNGYTDTICQAMVKK